MQKSIHVRIDVKTTKRLTEFLQNDIGIIDRSLYVLIVKKAVNFALDNKEEFLKYLKGDGSGNTR